MVTIGLFECLIKKNAHNQVYDILVSRYSPPSISLCKSKSFEVLFMSEAQMVQESCKSLILSVNGLFKSLTLTKKTMNNSDTTAS